MKKIFTLLAAAFVTLTGFAADRREGSIVVNDNSRKQLWIEVDGYRYANNDRSLVINNLRPGMHTVKVIAQQRYSDWGSIFNRNRTTVIYQSNVNVRPRQATYIMIDRSGRVMIDERRGNERDDDWGRGRDRDHDDRYDPYDDRYDGRNDDRFDPTRSAMDVQSFEMLKRALGRESFEKTRLEIARQTIDRNNFSSKQVREMALLFAFEDNKLDLARYAYGKTVDKNNYFIVNDVFSFSRSKEELAEYIRRYR